MRTIFGKMSSQAGARTGLISMTTKRALSSIVGANGRRLPLPDDKPLREHDPEVHNLLMMEQQRQHRGIELIASENFASRYVM